MVAEMTPKQRAEEAMKFEEFCPDGQKCGCAATTGCLVGKCQRKPWLPCKHWVTFEPGKVTPVVMTGDGRCPICRIEELERALVAQQAEHEAKEQYQRGRADGTELAYISLKKHMVDLGLVEIEPGLWRNDSAKKAEAERDVAVAEALERAAQKTESADWLYPASMCHAFATAIRALKPSNDMVCVPINVLGQTEIEMRQRGNRLANAGVLPLDFVDVTADRLKAILAAAEARSEQRSNFTK